MWFAFLVFPIGFSMFCRCLLVGAPGAAHCFLSGLLFAPGGVPRPSGEVDLRFFLVSLLCVGWFFLRFSFVLNGLARYPGGCPVVLFVAGFSVFGRPGGCPGARLRFLFSRFLRFRFRVSFVLKQLPRWPVECCCWWFGSLGPGARGRN